MKLFFGPLGLFERNWVERLGSEVQPAPRHCAALRPYLRRSEQLCHHWKQTLAATILEVAFAPFRARSD